MPALPELRFGPKGVNHLDYFVFDWSAHLAVIPGGDTIATALLSATPSGLTISGPSVKGAQAGAWIGAGAALASYCVVCSITTTGGRVLDWPASLDVVP